jgi:hypothetical protein
MMAIDDTVHSNALPSVLMLLQKGTCVQAFNKQLMNFGKKEKKGK